VVGRLHERSRTLR
jgi:hypothetical protein